jgi:hypothetical protein
MRCKSLSKRLHAEMDNIGYAVSAAAALNHAPYPPLALLLASQLIFTDTAGAGDLLQDVLDNSLTSPAHRQTALEYLAVDHLDVDAQHNAVDAQVVLEPSVHPGPLRRPAPVAYL